ncbi:unnamed protein product [Orchesella dallaii]
MGSKFARDCSGCNHFSTTRKRWLSHLLQPKHQEQARKACRSWSSKVKKCVVVVFANESIATKKGLCSFTESIGRDNTVVDFIFSERQPRVGIFKFESKAKVKEIMERFGDEVLVLDDELSLRLKKGRDYPGLEWNELLDEIKVDFSESDSDDDDDDDDSDESLNLQCRGREDKLHPVEDEGMDVETPSARSPNLYRQQFDAILSEIEIPDEEYQQALDVMEKCERIFAKEFPACKFYMFRHWYLKLRNNGTNELLFYVDFDGALDGSHPHKTLYDRDQPFKLQQEQVENLFTSKAGRKILPGVELVQNRQADHEPRAFQFLHTPSGLKFSIAGDSHFRTEAQTCRLVKFLLDSDNRARPLLTLIFYWANKCEVMTSQPIFEYPHLTHSSAPQPASLEWMVLLFLADKKIIPSPREVQQRVHKKLVIFSETDIGFSTAEWEHPARSGPPENSNEFFIHLVELAGDFFDFYSKLQSGSWILNTRDGEVILKKDFLSDNPKASQAERKTKLRQEEIAKIMKIKKKWEKRTFVMLHPLVCQWNIMMSVEACRFGGRFKIACAAALINLALERVEVKGEEFFLASILQPPTTKMLMDIVLKVSFAPNNIISRIEKAIEKSNPRGKKEVNRNGVILKKLTSLREKNKRFEESRPSARNSERIPKHLS